MFELLNEASKEVIDPRPRLRERYFGKLDNGTQGSALISALRKYLKALLHEVEPSLSGHSHLFWLRAWRDMRSAREGQRSAETRSTKARSRSDELLQECQTMVWLDHRITLAILKYSSFDLSLDMQILPPNSRGSSGRYSPLPMTKSDAAVLHLLYLMMWEFEHARYMLKRAGKGGRLIWTNRTLRELDVRLSKKLRVLVENFDSRGSGNLLSGYGSWAPIEYTYNFPMPTETPSYVEIAPWSGATPNPTQVPFDDDKLDVLTLIPNVAGTVSIWTDLVSQKKIIISPPWLFCWMNLESALPRLQLVQQTWRKKLELSGLSGYHPEDLILTLAAITRYQRRFIESANTLQWQQIFFRGYNIWTEAKDQIEGSVLPEFRSLRQSYGTTSRPADFELLNAVIEHFSWNQSNREEIDILELRPLKFILPLAKNIWLIDWSLTLECVRGAFAAFGRTWGGESALKGKEFEEALCEYISSQMSHFAADIWWVGRGARTRLQLPHGPSRDIDIAIRFERCLLLVEIKSHSARRDLDFVGDPEDLRQRWLRIEGDLDQIDDTARALAAAPIGKNYVIPETVEFILSVVCSSYREWIPTDNPRFWMYEEMPRVCTPEELMELITRLSNNRLPVSNRVSVQSKAHVL
jgi:hypothetical protein